MGNSRKNKSRVFGLETFSEFSHIIKVLVNMLIPPANQTQRSIYHGVLLTKKHKSRRRAKAFSVTTPFAVHYEKIRIHLREMATNGAKIHSLAPIN